MKALILVLAMAGPCFAKGPMVQGRFGDESRWIEFAVIDLVGTTTRVSDCNIVPECGRARVDRALCVLATGRQCPYLAEIVPTRIQFFPRSDTPWAVTFAWESERERPLFTILSSVTGEDDVKLILNSEIHLLTRLKH